MGILGDIKNAAKKSGQNKGKFLFIRDGEKKRIRFLQELDDGMKILFHDSYSAGVNVPCQELYDRECPYCDEEGFRHRDMFAWSVWDYDAGEVKIALYAVNNCSPVAALVNMSETYGTIMDRDYVLSVTGKQMNKTYGVVPMDKNSFKNKNAKPLSEKALLKILDKAFPCDDVDGDDEDEEEEDVKKSKKDSGKKLPKKQEDDWEDDEEDDIDYDEMTPKELYKLCKERKIDVVPKKSEKYYIKKLTEWDEAHSEWEDEEDEEDEEAWEDDE